MSRYRASLIISVYKDVARLDCILRTLRYQTATDFEIIVSEDGDSAQMRDYLAPLRNDYPQLRHLTQEDRGFRKNRALNRAIQAGHSDYFLFIDGDCVPHSHFIANHLRQAETQAVCAGRRVELGTLFSQRLIEQPDFLLQLESRRRYILLAAALRRDGIKNYEFGFVSPLLHRLAASRPIHIVGSNFSCSRQALETVNGFNEEFESPGIGEDADIDPVAHRAGTLDGEAGRRRAEGLPVNDNPGATALGVKRLDSHPCRIAAQEEETGNRASASSRRAMPSVTSASITLPLRSGTR